MLVFGQVGRWRKLTKLLLTNYIGGASALLVRMDKRSWWRPVVRNASIRCKSCMYPVLELRIQRTTLKIHCRASRLTLRLNRLGEYKYKVLDAFDPALNIGEEGKPDPHKLPRLIYYDTTMQTVNAVVRRAPAKE